MNAEISGQSIGIDKNITFHNFYSSIKTVGATVFGGLWALEWAWHSTETVGVGVGVAHC